MLPTRMMGAEGIDHSRHWYSPGAGGVAATGLAPHAKTSTSNSSVHMRRCVRPLLLQLPEVVAAAKRILLATNCRQRSRQQAAADVSGAV